MKKITLLVLSLMICAPALLAFTGGQSQTQYHQFNQRQQQAARTYYDKNKDQPVFKQPDQWSNDNEGRLQQGQVLDDNMRKWSHPAPAALTRSLGRPPRGYRHVVIGPHVVLVDSGNRVHDAIHLELNVGH